MAAELGDLGRSQCNASVQTGSGGPHQQAHSLEVDFGRSRQKFSFFPPKLKTAEVCVVRYRVLYRKQTQDS